MILLTGATGRTGGETARVLARMGVKVRALVRSVDKAAGLKAAGIELAMGDVTDAASVQRALEGVERLLVLLPNGERQLELEKQLVDLAKRAGARHIVKLSSMEAMASAQTPIPQAHWASEEYIRKSGLDWTMIKPNYFMQNLLSSARAIKESKSFSLPVGNGTSAMIDTRDIGAVNAEVLTGEGHQGQSYEITGPELLTFSEVAAQFSIVLGTRISYVAADPAQYLEILRRVLPNEWHAEAVAALFRGIAEGCLDRTTDTFLTLMGRQPIGLGQFIRDHSDAFR